MCYFFVIRGFLNNLLEKIFHEYHQNIKQFGSQCFVGVQDVIELYTYLGVGSSISVNHEQVYVSDHSHGVLDGVELSYSQVNTANSCSEST